MKWKKALLPCDSHSCLARFCPSTVWRSNQGKPKGYLRAPWAWIPCLKAGNVAAWPSPKKSAKKSTRLHSHLDIWFVLLCWDPWNSYIIYCRLIHLHQITRSGLRQHFHRIATGLWIPGFCGSKSVISMHLFLALLGWAWLTRFTIRCYKLYMQVILRIIIISIEN